MDQSNYNLRKLYKSIKNDVLANLPCSSSLIEKVKSLREEDSLLYDK